MEIIINKEFQNKMNMALYGREIEQIEVHGVSVVDAKNCRVGRTYAVPYRTEMHPGGLKYRWYETKAGPQVDECPTDDVCSVGGSRGRKEWCNDCDRIV